MLSAAIIYKATDDGKDRYDTKVVHSEGGVTILQKLVCPRSLRCTSITGNTQKCPMKAL